VCERCARLLALLGRGLVCGSDGVSRNGARLCTIWESDQNQPGQRAAVRWASSTGRAANHERHSPFLQLPLRSGWRAKWNFGYGNDSHVLVHFVELALQRQKS
jgi:hypothetical protein